jgi:flagellar basal body-associated protein FliL
LESKSTFFILIVIVAVLALSLAALAGYLVIIQGNSGNGDKNGDKGQIAENGEEIKEIPNDEDLIKVSLFGDARYFALKKTDPKQSSIIQANVTLKCYKTLKRDKKADVSEIIASRSEEIQELVVKFFMTLTAKDVEDLAVLDKAKEDLTDQINSLLNEGEEKPEDIVYKVIFSEWLFQ